MATQLKSNILETFVTVLGTAMIDAIYNDKFFFSLFENASTKFGADTINKQGDTVKLIPPSSVLKVLPSTSRTQLLPLST
jgi:hypothetical protein